LSSAGACGGPGAEEEESVAVKSASSVESLRDGMVSAAAP